jgi:hypothetical protein
MGIGPTLSCGAELLEKLPRLAASRKIKMEVFVERRSNDLNESVYIFKSHMGRIVGRERQGFLWLTFPKSHAFNPFLWPFGLRLSQELQNILLQNGAQHYSWEDSPFSLGEHTSKE